MTINYDVSTYVDDNAVAYGVFGEIVVMLYKGHIHWRYGIFAIY